MITLHQFPAGFDVPNISPFCLKVETYLRMTGLEYKVRSTFNPRKAPKAKLPYIELDGEKIADSEIIVRELSKRLGADMDSQLTAAERGRALCITRTCDEHLVSLMVYFRWLDDEGWQQVKPAFFGRMPLPLRRLVPGIVQKALRKNFYGQGLGRHSRDELLQFAAEDLQALNDLLGEADYFGGTQPCSADASAYGVLANLILSSLETPVNRLAREHPALVRYCERVRERYWQ